MLYPGCWILPCNSQWEVEVLHHENFGIFGKRETDFLPTILKSCFKFIWKCRGGGLIFIHDSKGRCRICCFENIPTYYIHITFFSLLSDKKHQCYAYFNNKHFIAWFSRAYDLFSLSQKTSLTRLFHLLVRDLFFAHENVSYALITHAIIYTY